MFDDKYMKLFDGLLNAIHTFSLHMKQFLSDIFYDFSDILQTLSYTALDKDVMLMNLLYTYFKQGINLYVHKLWQLA